MLIWIQPVTLFYQTATELVRGVLGLSLRGREINRQIYECGVLSLPIIIFSLSIVSLMSVLEFSWHMKIVLNQDALVPGFSMVLMVREVAPVVTAMLITSRVGASIAAEIGVMKITEQLDQLKLLRISEVEFILLPRWIACMVTTTSLNLIALLTAVGVTSLLGSRSMGYQIHEFYNSLFVFTKMHDFWGSVLKSICFGTLIPFISASCGLNCRSGSRAVGQAATQAVVRSSLTIIILDFVINSLWWVA